MKHLVVITVPYPIREKLGLKTTGVPEKFIKGHLSLSSC